MKRLILSFIIIAQVLIIGIILHNILQKQSLVSTISPIKKKDIVLTNSDYLRYFYEPKSNSILKPDTVFSGLENVSYKINKDGLNQIENYPVSKEKNVFRIVTIGDSFTFGENVSTEENYPSQLQQLLNTVINCSPVRKFEVLNLGVSGYDIQYTVERFRLRGKKYNPDVVLWLLIHDDFRRINELFLPKSNIYVTNARKKGIYANKNPLRMYEEEKNRAKEDIKKDLGGSEGLLSLQRSFFTRFNSIYKGMLVMMYIPSPQDPYIPILLNVKDERKKTYLLLNLPKLSQTEETLLADLHPSKTGHEIIANTALNYLVKNKLIPCRFK